MTTIDYEVEYNNRARVPRSRRSHRRLGARCAGISREYTADPDPLRPGGTRDPGSVHARGLRAGKPHSSSFTAAIGRPSTRASSAIWHARQRARDQPCHSSYDLCPQVSISQIIAQIRAACRDPGKTRTPPRGQRHILPGGIWPPACWRQDWEAGAEPARRDLVQAGYAISGLFDLTPLMGTSINTALGLDSVSARAASPLFTPPLRPGLTFDAVVGGDESAEYHRQSRTIVARWGEAGVATHFESLPGCHHFDVIAPLADPESAMTRRLVALAGG